MIHYLPLESAGVPHQIVERRPDVTTSYDQVTCPDCVRLMGTSR